MECPLACSLCRRDHRLRKKNPAISAVMRGSPSQNPPVKSTNLIIFFFISFSFNLLLTNITIAASSDVYSDAQALLAFKQSTGNAANRNLASWTSASIASICTTWAGVGCGKGVSSQRVISLRLPGKSLYGPIPVNTLGKLDAIEALSLRSNKLSGYLPADLVTNCTSLKRLFLHHNNFSGSLPLYISSSWPLLSQLDLSFNSFSGVIPASITNLTHLRSLFLQNNSFSGPLPSLNTVSPNNFSVANNKLSGPISPSLRNFSAQSFSGNGDLCGYPLPNVCTPTTNAPGTSPNSRPEMPSPNTTSEKSTFHRHRSKGVIAGIAAGSFGAAMVMVLLFCFFCKCEKGRRSSSSRTKKQEPLEVDNVFMRTSYQGGGGGSPYNYSPRKSVGRKQASTSINKKTENQLTFLGKEGNTMAAMFDLEDLLRASAEVLGKGSLGTAYKAMLDDGMVVVVKRLREVMCENEDFKHRMDSLGCLNHPNLVPLRAYYFANTEKLLVLDYMPHGSLSALLHGNTAKQALDWKGRLNVAIMVAQAVAYLHSQKVVHGNLKSSNVLMRSDGLEGTTWQVADYGLVQLALFSPMSNVKLMGYIAPEVSDMRSVTPKVDVYSYGVLLLELLTGKSPILTAFDDDTLDLPKQVHASLLRDPHIVDKSSLYHHQHNKSIGDQHSLFDPHLLKLDYNTHDDMMQLLHISLLCTYHTPQQRPSMADVISMLENLQKSHGDEVDNDNSEEDRMYYGYHP